MLREKFVVGLEEGHHFLLIFRAVLEDLFDEEVKNIFGSIVLLDLLNLLLGEVDQIMEGVLISLEPDSLCQFFYTLFIIYGGYFLEVEVFGPFIWLNRPPKAQIEQFLRPI